jgi:hypothetical protein
LRKARQFWLEVVEKTPLSGATAVAEQVRAVALEMLRQRARVQCQQAGARKPSVQRPLRKVAKIPARRGHR